MADSLYDYLPLSVLFVFLENEETLCTQEIRLSHIEFIPAVE